MYMRMCAGAQGEESSRSAAQIAGFEDGERQRQRAYLCGECSGCAYCNSAAASWQGMAGDGTVSVRIGGGGAWCGRVARCA